MNQSITKILAMWTPGPIELIIIGIIALLVFGKRLPEMARGLGASFTQFKKGLKEAKDAKEHIENEVKDSVSVDEQGTNNMD